jgi:alkylation response protein AidB-like acyl-CoA dehydrogenase
MANLYSTEAYTRAAADLLDLVGTSGLGTSAGGDHVGVGVIEHAYRHSQVTTIYGGASEIQRGIIRGARSRLAPQSRGITRETFLRLTCPHECSIIHADHC